MFHIKNLFFIMSLYYTLCGAVFAFSPASFFDYFRIEYPNHWGYVHFIGLSAFIWALMSWRVSVDPLKSRSLIPYLALMQIFYTLGIFIDSGLFGMPSVWKYMAYASAVTGIVYYSIYYLLGKPLPVEEKRKTMKRKK